MHVSDEILSGTYFAVLFVINRRSDEVMQPDHAYSIEPGTYIPNKTEYRHSNAILSIEDGAEQITDYSRGLEENIIR